MRMGGLTKYISALHNSDEPHFFMQHSFLDAIDFTVQFEELLQRTFPELLPVDWGFDRNAR